MNNLIDKTSLTKTIRNVFNDKKSRHVVNTLFNLVSNEHTFRNGISKKTLLFAGVNLMVHYLSEVVSIDPGSFHQNDGDWYVLQEFSGLTLDMSISLLAGYPKRVLNTTNEHIDICIVTINNKFQLSWIDDLMSNDCNQCLYCKGDQQEASEFLTSLFWEKYGSQSLTLTIDHNGLSIFALVPDNVVPKSSENALDVVRNQEKYIAHSVNRAIMLVGRPGTGKTTMAKSIVSQLKLKSLTVDCTIIDKLKLSDVIKLTRLLKPGAVILDDYDKLSSQKNLNFLHTIRTLARLVIYTVNDATKFDESVVRPERIDEIVIVERLDKNTVLSILGEEYADCYETVADWPIMYIKEYMIRCTVLGKEDAKSSLKELSKRVNILSTKRSYMDCNSFLTSTSDGPVVEELDDELEEVPQEAKVSAIANRRKKKSRQLMSKTGTK
jgi:hypothetical protein